MMKPMNIK